MNGEIIVPVDLTGEEKEILAFFSKRQFFLIFPPGIITGFFVILGNIPFVSGFLDFLIRLIIFLLVTSTGILLAYIKLDKYEQYLSDYMFTYIQFKTTQQTYYYE